jgi:rare lipoprotein A
MRLLLLSALIFVSGLSVNAQQNQKQSAKGVASFYHDKFEGRPTATGETFDNDKFTAASNTLKLGSYVKVTNLSNGEKVYVRINDRMNKTNQRLIDLASVAAQKLNFQQKGITNVKVEVVPAEEGRQGILAQNAAKKSSSNKL